MKPAALTVTGSGLLRVIQTPVGVHVPTNHPMDTQLPPSPQNYQGIWDTGATGSVITKRVIDELGLKPTGMTQVHGVSGVVNSNTYLINISLPNHVVIQSITVTEGQLTGADVLIGMDIISLGDFIITNCNGQTVMSFRMPSAEPVDFVKQIQANIPIDQKLPRAERRRQEREIAKQLRKQSNSI